MQIGILQKRLASSILKCGKRKIWIDPNEINEVAAADSRGNIRKLIKEGIIVKKNCKIHSKNRKKLQQEARKKGKHKGIGSRKGTSNARSSQSYKWHFKQKVFRHLLKKYRKLEKIDSHLYRELYLKAKGNVFRNKRVLLDFIHKTKTEKNRRKDREMQQFARRKKRNVAHDKLMERFDRYMDAIHFEAWNQ